RVVADRPGRRDAVGVPHLLEVLAAQPVEDAPPELGVAADAVVRVGTELAAVLVEPALVDAVAEVLPDRLRVPVLIFLRDEVAALEDERPGARAGERVRERAAACAAADDDDVVTMGHRLGIREAACPERCRGGSGIRPGSGTIGSLA